MSGAPGGPNRFISSGGGGSSGSDEDGSGGDSDSELPEEFVNQDIESSVSDSEPADAGLDSGSSGDGESNSRGTGSSQGGPGGIGGAPPSPDNNGSSGSSSSGSSGSSSGSSSSGSSGSSSGSSSSGSSSSSPAESDSDSDSGGSVTDRVTAAASTAADAARSAASSVEQRVADFEEQAQADPSESDSGEDTADQLDTDFGAGETEFREPDIGDDTPTRDALETDPGGLQARGREAGQAVEDRISDDDTFLPELGQATGAIPAGAALTTLNVGQASEEVLGDTIREGPQAGVDTADNILRSAGESAAEDFDRSFDVQENGAAFGLPRVEVREEAEDRVAAGLTLTGVGLAAGGPATSAARTAASRGADVDFDAAAGTARDRLTDEFTGTDRAAMNLAPGSGRSPDSPSTGDSDPTDGPDTPSDPLQGVTGGDPSGGTAGTRGRFTGQRRTGSNTGIGDQPPRSLERESEFAERVRNEIEGESDAETAGPGTEGSIPRGTVEGTSLSLESTAPGALDSAQRQNPADILDTSQSTPQRPDDPGLQSTTEPSTGIAQEFFEQDVQSSVTGSVTGTLGPDDIATPGRTEPEPEPVPDQPVPTRVGQPVPPRTGQPTDQPTDTDQPTPTDTDQPTPTDTDQPTPNRPEPPRQPDPDRILRPDPDPDPDRPRNPELPELLGSESDPDNAGLALESAENEFSSGIRGAEDVLRSR